MTNKPKLVASPSRKKDGSTPEDRLHEDSRAFLNKLADELQIDDLEIPRDRDNPKVLAIMQRLKEKEPPYKYWY